MDHDHTMTGGFQSGYGTAIWSPDLTPMGEGQYIGALIGLFLLSIGFRALVAAQGYLEAYLHLHYYPHPRHNLSSFASPTHGQQELEHLHNAEADRGRQEQEIYLDEKHIVSTSQEDTPKGQRVLQNEEEIAQESSLQPQAISPASATPTTTTSTRSTNPKSHKSHKSRRPPLYQTSDLHSKYPGDYELNSSNSSTFLSPLPTAQPFVWQAEMSRALLTTAVVGIGYMLMLVVMTYNSAYFAMILIGIFVGEVYFSRWGRVRPVFPASSSSQLRRAAKCTPGLYTDVHGQHQQQHNPASISATSLTSRSSHGYSTMIHHGASVDAC
ncbi:hypothetical protein EDD11_009082 [Mortierella claussenii]|nr:hypothetical protein EDD11_009082 [Mortierella claussenii]